MRHRRRVKHFSRKSGPRKALLRGLVTALVENERISTTVDKAKELRRHVERAITMGKKNTLSCRRLLLSRYPNQAAVQKIVDQLSPRFKERQGGYTRIIRTGRRPGDTAEMAFIEFVDYDYTAPRTGFAAPEVKAKAKKSEKVSKAKSKGKATEAAAETKVAKVGKSSKKSLAAMRKTRRKIQNQSRADNRA